MNHFTHIQGVSQSDLELVDKLVRGQELTDEQTDYLSKVMVENKALRVAVDEQLELATVLTGAGR